MMININSHAFRQKYSKLNQVNHKQNNQRVKSDNVSFGVDRKSLVNYGLPVALGLSLLTGCREDSATTFNPSVGNSLNDFQNVPVKSLEYFKEIAGGSEFGGQKNIRKWPQGEIRVCASGQQNDADKQELTRIVNDLNGLITPSNQIVQSCQNPQIEITYAPESEFKTINPNYVPRNLGFFWSRHDANNQISKADILIDSSNNVTQQERNHLTREELTQSMGLMNDSNKYPDSIFQQSWTDTNEYSPIDRDLVRILYDPRVQPGMSVDQAASLFTGSAAQIANNAASSSNLAPVATLPDSQVAIGTNPSQATVPVAQAPVPQRTLAQESRQIARNLGQRARSIDWTNVAIRANNTLRRINGETASSPQPQSENPYYMPSSSQVNEVPVQGFDPVSVGQGNARSGGSVDACYTTPNPGLCIQTYNDTLRSQ